MASATSVFDIDQVSSTDSFEDVLLRHQGELHKGIYLFI
jgi:hypothetical protein